MRGVSFWNAVSLIWVTISATTMFFIAMTCFIASESALLGISYLALGFLFTGAWCYFAGRHVWRDLLGDK